MADKKKNDLIVEVGVPEKADADWMKEQNEALMHYRVSGEAGVYVDPTRDQEPDIAPELGVAPHPDMANPAPPASSFSGRALDPNQNPMVQSVDEKEENSKEATEAFNEALQEREEKLANLAKSADFPAGAQPVYIVDRAEPLEGAPSLPADESPKAAQQNPDAKLAQSFDESDSKSSK